MRVVAPFAATGDPPHLPLVAVWMRCEKATWRRAMQHPCWPAKGRRACRCPLYRSQRDRPTSCGRGERLSRPGILLLTKMRMSGSHHSTPLHAPLHLCFCERLAVATSEAWPCLVWLVAPSSSAQTNPYLHPGQCQLPQASAEHPAGILDRWKTSHGLCKRVTAPADSAVARQGAA